MKKPILFSLFSLFLLFIAMPSVYAHCPLCTAAVGAAAVSAKYLGLDTSIIGLFIGAFAIVTGIFIGLKIKKYFKFQLPLIVLASFLLTVIPILTTIKGDIIFLPMLLFGSSGSIFNKIYFIDKMLIGSVIGAIVSLLGYWLHNYIKKAKGKVLFPYQGIAFTLGLLIIAGGILFFSFGG